MQGGLLAWLMWAVLAGVAALWAVRWWFDQRRQRERAAAMVGQAFEPCTDTQALSARLSALGYPLRDWIMRGHSTGVTTYAVRDAWTLARPGLTATAMEVQTTPGYMGWGVPVWRERHAALLCVRDTAWPAFELWGEATTDRLDQRLLTYPLHLPDGRQRHAVHGCMVTAADPAAAWQAFEAVWLPLNEPLGSHLFAMTHGQALWLVWRKQPPDGTTLRRWLLAAQGMART